MVRAILDGRKTQTRRIVEPQPDDFHTCWREGKLDEDGDWVWWLGVYPSASAKNKYGKPGGKLWVRETFQFVHANSDGQRNTFRCAAPFTQNDYRWIEYAATPKDNEPPPTWKPSIFMPRWASRITLEITGVRVERLRDIDADSASAEGCGCGVNDETGPVARYSKLWETINGKGSWESNPWVWVVAFKQVFNADFREPAQ